MSVEEFVEMMGITRDDDSVDLDEMALPEEVDIDVKCV